MRLTIKDRILLHLHTQRKHADRHIQPETVTQDGIAKALGITRSHAAVELNKLDKEKLVERRSTSVNGTKLKRVTYRLTPLGSSTVDELAAALDTPLDVAIRRNEPTIRLTAKQRLEDLQLEAVHLREALEKLERRIEELAEDMPDEEASPLCCPICGRGEFRSRSGVNLHIATKHEGLSIRERSDAVHEWKARAAPLLAEVVE